MNIFKSIENFSAKLYERRILKGMPFDPLPSSPQEKPETEEDPHVEYLGADAIPSSELKGIIRITIPDEQKNQTK